MEKFVSLKVAAERKIHGEDIGKETAFKVAPHLIEVEPGFNRPISRERVESFKISMRNEAIIPPIFVRVDVGRIIMVDGEHRLIAAKELIAEGMEIPHLSAIHFRGDDGDAICHKISTAHENGIAPLEQGRDYQKLLRLGRDEKKIAGRVGLSVGHIKMCLSLQEANTDVKEHITAGTISGTEAAKLLKQHGSKTGEVIGELKKEAEASGQKKVTAKTVAKKQGPSKRELAIAEAVAGAITDCWDESMKKFVANVSRADLAAIIAKVEK